MSVTKVYDIPIISRGKIIEPGENAIEFGGRVGARFRCPDPLDHINDLVLSRGSDLQDIYDTPMDEIIDLLHELGPRLSLDNPYMKEAFDLCLEAGELTESVLLPVYENAQKMFNRQMLELQIEGQLGKDYIDGWVEQGVPGKSLTRIRAIGTRQVHVIAGNVPITAAMTVIRTALTKSDSLVKLPSNDPLTTTAIVRSLIDMAPDHPVTRHLAVAYWKGGNETLERQIYHPSRIERITAWGGMSSMTHIQKYLVPGIELIPMNPKLSISIIGNKALQDPASMKEAADGISFMAGRMNQTACSSTRLVYVECDGSEEQLQQLEKLGELTFEAFQNLPASVSTPAKKRNPGLEEELEALSLDDTFYTVIGDTIKGGVIVSKTSEPVEFATRLNNRIVNLVPMEKIEDVCSLCSEETQTVGIYPESLHPKLRDQLTLNGVQRMIPLGADMMFKSENPREMMRTPHDGIEPLRRSVRWIIDQSASPLS